MSPPLSFDLNFLDPSNIIIIIINVVNIFIAFKMMIMIIVDVQGNIYLELSKLKRERGGGKGKVLEST